MTHPGSTDFLESNLILFRTFNEFLIIAIEFSRIRVHLRLQFNFNELSIKIAHIFSYMPSRCLVESIFSGYQSCLLFFGIKKQMLCNEQKCPEIKFVFFITPINPHMNENMFQTAIAVRNNYK